MTTTCFTLFMELVERTTVTSLLDRPGSSHNAVKTLVSLLKCRSVRITTLALAAE